MTVDAIPSTLLGQLDRLEKDITYSLERFGNYLRGFQFKFERSENLRKTRLILQNVKWINPRDLVEAISYAQDSVDFEVSELRQVTHLGGYLEITTKPNRGLNQ
jgi:hypothetical protein